MQSAKDFAIYLDNELGSGDRLFLQDCCVDDIRARDREIVEACKRIAIDIEYWTLDGPNENALQERFDNFLRDLG